MVFRPDYPLNTARLRLRPFTRGDVDGVFHYRGQDVVARYLFDPPLSREECALAIQLRINQLALDADEDRIVLAVEKADDAALVGEVSLILRSLEARQGELGWIFDPDHHGRGYAFEAVSTLVDLAFHQADLHRLFARCDAANSPSWRLMERLGMRREAHFREHARIKGAWAEEFHYALLRREWLSMRQSFASS